MKRVVLLTILFCLSAVLGFPQKSKLPIKPNASKQTTVQQLTEIPAAEWKILTDAVQIENWDKSTLLANGYLTKIKVENDKKQMARLRYILLYALAGKIVVLSSDGKKSEENKTRTELEKTANGFLDKEFFMPSREMSDDCQGKLNYICQSKQQKNVLRASATTQTGTAAILSFEYVRLKVDFAVKNYAGKQAILDGVLKKIEFNPNKSSVWIMRLFFENGSVNVVPEK